ncbi:streptomycin 3''-adenylyltransferase [Clostridium tepidiprofundi DSM 19306]|uniref:Streptomycin 3''-adenylyltransferase n=1 Tax=Clostridium tepidiprofundi DSM 19306 TaxID=1121338 RepID=A0A151B3C3_9CLOT|nr:aminoglycoside adenylyltransferase domain-containing protein [Clostridium tepidiprofundi]KYH34252.1 streptomycin 3''-adenylyltransferase [Clostridium tepidiprofundi DSM 19306]
MIKINEILNVIISNYHEILKTDLVGIYLHGSLAMNCFNPDSSDIDFLVIVKKDISFKAKKKLIDVLLKLSKDGPRKGFEMSIILEKDAQNFTYPTPFILHYSDYYKEKYISNPQYICGNSTDPDLAAHIVITIERGRCLFGKPIKEVFQTVPKKYYIESIISDIQDAKEEITNNPIYSILNLCRVLYYLKERAVCSKKEGGEWAIENLTYQYIDTVKLALLGYINSDNTIEWNQDQLICFADFMLEEINNEYVVFRKNN